MVMHAELFLVTLGFVVGFSDSDLTKILSAFDADGKTLFYLFPNIQPSI